MSQRFCFEKDDDGHWYLIPVDKRLRFNELMLEIYSNSDNKKVWKEWNETFEPLSLGGSPFVYSFTDPKADQR